MQNETLDGAVLTQARHNRGDVVMMESDRGGVCFSTISYMDVLLESDIITEPQYALGKSYWTMRDTAFIETKMRIGKYDYTPEQDTELLYAIETETAEPGMATEFYRAITKRMAYRDLQVLDASCHVLEAAYLPVKMAIIQAFGENTLAAAFSALENIYEKAKEDAEFRMSKENA